MAVYLKETLAYMRLRELNLPPYRQKSPQINKRRILVDWTCLCGEKFDLEKSAINLAIVILDLFMDGHDFTDSDSLPYVCMASLSLAAKFDCKETRVPKYSKLKNLIKEQNPSPKTYSREQIKELWKPLEFRRLEGMIMAHFNWNIFIPTPTHYVDLLEPQIVFPTDLIHGRLIAKEIYPEVVERLMEFVNYFLDISMQEGSLVGVEHAKIAAASIYCARSVLDMTPVWPFNLQRLLGGLRTVEFEHCNRLLLSVYVFEDSSQNEELVLSEHQGRTTPPPAKKAKQEIVNSSTVIKTTPSPLSPTNDEGYVSKSSFVLTPGPTNALLDEIEN